MKYRIHYTVHQVLTTFHEDVEVKGGVPTRAQCRAMIKEMIERENIRVDGKLVTVKEIFIVEQL